MYHLRLKQLNMISFRVFSPGTNTNCGTYTPEGLCVSLYIGSKLYCAHINLKHNKIF